MLHVGLDLSRRRLDVCLVDDVGELVEHTAAPPDADGLRHSAERFAGRAGAGGDRVDDRRAVRARHAGGARAGRCWSPTRRRSRDWRRWRARPTRSTRACWPSCPGVIWCRRSGCPTRRFAVSASWPATGCTWSGIARRLKNRIHATLMTFGHPCPVSDLFGHAGRELLDRLQIPDPWRRNVDASLELIDDLELQIAVADGRAPAARAPITATSRCWSPRPGSAGSTPTPSPRRSATSSASPRRPSSAATPASARASTSPAPPTAAARSPSTARATCAGRCSRPRCTPATTPSTASATSAPSNASAANAAPRSPRSTSPESSPRRSGTCSPATNPSLRQAPRFRLAA